MLIYADGAGNGEIAVVAEHIGGQIETHHTIKSVKTHNEAEWEALLLAISVVKTYNPVIIRMDSELVVKQFNGEYRTKKKEMAEYKQAAFQKIRDLGLDIRVEWIPRERNRAGWDLEKTSGGMK